MNNLMDKLASGYLKGHLDLSPEEAAEALIFVIDYHVRNQSDFVPQLVKKYGKSESSDKKSQIKYFSTEMYPDLMNEKNGGPDLFWKMFNALNRAWMAEGIHSAFADSSQEVLNEMENS